VTDDRSTTHERLIAAPPADVYDAFRDPAKLTRWWGPNGFTSTFETFEFREGGKWRFVLHAPDGKDHPNVNEFAELVPDRRVRIEHVEGHWFMLTVDLAPEGDGTRVRWRQEFPSKEELETLRPYVVPANEQNLDRLAAVVTGSAP
jgi:uncharacterized protein YndB with AHSA1/START domain